VVEYYGARRDESVVPTALVPWGFQKAMGIGTAEDKGNNHEDVNGCESSEHVSIL
jgi:hypothetical protein